MQKKLIQNKKEQARFRLLELDDNSGAETTFNLEPEGPISRFRNLELDDEIPAAEKQHKEARLEAYERFRYLEMDDDNLTEAISEENSSIKDSDQAYKEFKQRLSEFRLLEMPDGELPAIYKQAKALKLIESLGPSFTGQFADGRNYLACIVADGRGFLNNKTLAEQVQLLNKYGFDHAIQLDISTEIGLLNIAAAKNFVYVLQQKAPRLIYRNYRIMTGEVKNVFSANQAREEILNIQNLKKASFKQPNKPYVVHLGNNSAGPLDNFADHNTNTQMVIAAYIP